MKKYKISIILLSFLLVITSINSVLTHQKLTSLILSSFTESARLVEHYYNAYLNAFDLLDQPEEIKLANMTFAFSLNARITLYMHDSTIHLDEKIYKFWHQYFNETYEMFYDAVESNDKAKLEQARSRMFKVYVNLMELEKTFNDRKLINVPVVGEYIIKKEMFNVINNLQEN